MILLFTLLFSSFVAFLQPRPLVLNLTQAHRVLDVSVLVHAKESLTTPEGTRIGVIGCSGTFISEDRVLTAAHCFANPVYHIWVRGYNEKSQEAFLGKVDKDKDLAILLVPAHGGHKYALLAKTSRVGQAVYIVGSPFGMEFLLSEGIVSKLGVICRPFTGRYVCHTGMINSGSSGGGAFNSAGELLGVNTLTIGGPFGWAGISLAVDGQTIRDFLWGSK